MLSLILALSVGAGLGVIAPWCFIKVRRRRESKAFARDVCEHWALPRDIGWFKGGFIRTDLDRSGQSVFIFKGRWAKFPATLTDNGVEAWNITGREARVFVQVLFARFDDLDRPEHIRIP